jgi:type I restriction enzyme S subunit
MSNGTQTLPPGWRLTPLQELATFETGRTPARAVPEFWAKDGADGIPWVSIADMRPYGIIRSTAERITPKAQQEVLRHRISKRGTLLMSFKLTIGKVATLGIDAGHNEAIISIFPNGRINQKYLEYFLSQVDYAEYQDRQVKGQTLNQEKIDRIQVAEPPKPEQEKIAAVLWKIQHAIEIEEKLIETTRELKQASLYRLFSHGLRNEQQKETEAGPLPLSWNLKRLEECCDVVSSSLSYTDFADMAETTGIDTISAMGIKVSDMNLLGNETHILKANLRKSVSRKLADKKFVAPNTVVFPKRGAAIATNKKRMTTAWTVLDPNLIGVQAGEGVDSDFLFYWFQKFDLRTITEPGPTPQLNKKNLTPLLLPVPSDPLEQTEIVGILQKVDSKISVHKRRRATLQELFKTVLHQLMTGDIRVADLDIDVSEIQP